MMAKYIIFFCLIQFITCWPNFFFFSQSNKDTHVTLTPQNIATSGFNNSKETKFVIHGFTDDGLDPKLVKIKDNFLNSKFDYNIILVDWKEGAEAPNYFEAAKNCEVTGTKVGQFIKESGIDISKVHCIGHSLGAHACGFAGKVGKLHRISGLDPAGPLFVYKKPNHRLDKNDAYFVDNIHTDSNLGIHMPIGHLDFFPGGGRMQLGCGVFERSNEESKTINIKIDPRMPELKMIGCSHNRAPAYFAESIISNCGFHSIPCENYDDFANGRCECDQKLGCPKMGFFADQIFPEGTYFLDTNKHEPFCMNK